VTPSATTPPKTRRSRLATAWSVISYIGFLLLFFGIIVVPAYMGGWRFGSWLREVVSILWPLAIFISPLAMLAAHSARKAGDSDEAYRWMFRAAIFALVSLLMLWLTVRNRL
jgi:hypothetical protein